MPDYQKRIAKKCGVNKILLTFDLEYWTESLSLKKYLKGDEPDDLAPWTEKILNFLSLNNTKATFFVSGQVLNKQSHLIKKISTAGHEIAIHSLEHKPLWELNPQSFDHEIKTLKKKITTLTGQEPIGYRAPNFSLTQKTKWALPILIKNDLKYDSSIFPYKHSKKLLFLFKNYVYGLTSNIHKPYKIDLNNPTKVDANSPLYEFPISIWHWKKLKYPITGGIYIRLTPFFIFKRLLKNKLKKEPATLHLHPFDFMEKHPKIKMPFLKKFIKFYNTKNTEKKLKYLLSNFSCTSIKKYLKNHNL